MTQETEQKLVPVPYELLVRARHIVGDRAAGGRMLTTRSAASAVWNELFSIMNAAPPAPSGWRSMETPHQDAELNDAASALAAPSPTPVSGGEGEAVAWLDELERLANAALGPHSSLEVHCQTMSAFNQTANPDAVKRLIAMARAHPSDPDATERMRAGDLLWYNIGGGCEVRCTYRGDCEGWPLVTFDADNGLEAPQPVRPSRVSPRAALGEA